MEAGASGQTGEIAVTTAVGKAEYERHHAHAPIPLLPITERPAVEILKRKKSAINSDAVSYFHMTSN